MSTLQQRTEALIEAAEREYQQDLYAITAAYEAGLMTPQDYETAVAGCRKLLDWNIGQAHIAFEVDK